MVRPVRLFLALVAHALLTASHHHEPLGLLCYGLLTVLVAWEAWDELKKPRP